MRLLCGSINVRERPWASKRQPIDYKRCCTDRLNAQGKMGHQADVIECPSLTLSRPRLFRGRVLGSKTQRVEDTLRASPPYEEGESRARFAFKPVRKIKIRSAVK